MPVNNTGDLISKALLDRALASIDMEALLKEIKPQVEKQIKQDILQAIKDYDFTDLIYDSLGEMNITKEVQKVVISVLKKAV